MDGRIRAMANINSIIKQFEQERDRIDSAIRALRGAGSRNGASPSQKNPVGRRSKAYRSGAESALGKGESRKEMNVKSTA